LHLTGSDPICSSNYTQSTLLKWGDVIQLSCTIVYGSMRKYPIDAVMTWSVNGQPIPADNAIFTIASSPTEVTARSTLHISKYFGASYECATTFSQPSGDYPADPTHVMATNAPDYLKKCTISSETNLQIIYNLSLLSNIRPTVFLEILALYLKHRLSEENYFCTNLKILAFK